MHADDHLIGELAGAILDGAAVDWPAADLSASATERPLLEELRLLAAVADLHRQAPPSPSALAKEAGAPHDDTGLEFWGHLRLLERIGAGSFGEVYRAWDTRLDREVALKLLRVSCGADARSSDVMVREGRLLARVRHPGVVTIYDAQQIGARVGLSMELVRGRTLAQRIEQEGVFDPGEATQIGIDLCRALSAVHAAGLLHRDLKAANVMRADDGRVVLMDFGAGRELGDLVDTGSAGTPLYVAPEVLQGQPATVQSDVYSLGVLVYHLLTGSYPVRARSLPELRQAHERRPRRSVRVERPDLPARLAAVIDRAIDPRPERRYESAAALAAALEAFRCGTRSRSWLLGAAAALLLLVTGSLLATRGDWLPATGSTPTVAATEPAGQVRIAVLPFASAGSEPDADMLREAMVEGLIGRLQTYGGASVISTASAFSIDAMKLPLGQVRSRLGLSAVLTGTLRRSGDTIQVRARLLALPGEREIWSAQYTQPVTKIPALQHDIVSGVAGALRLKTEDDAPPWPTRDPRAYALYLRGRLALEGRTSSGAHRAVRFFEQALELDPAYAQAYAGIAEVYLHVPLWIPNVAPEEAFARAAAAADRALSLAPSLPEAHLAAAYVSASRFDWDRTEHEYRRAIELGPSYALAREQYALWLALVGCFDEGLAQARQAQSVDPLSARANAVTAAVLRFARRYDEAIVEAQHALDLDPNYGPAFHVLGLAYQGLGRLDEAIAAYSRMGRTSGSLGHASAVAGRTDEARALVTTLEQRYADSGVGAGEIAQIHAGLGDVDRALEWLERATPSGAGGPATLKVAPVWDPLRSDPRFDTLLERVGLAGPNRCSAPQ